MDEVFKTRVVEAPQEPEIAPQGAQPAKSDKLAGNEDKASDELTQEEHNLDIWEGLKRTKYVTEFFGVKEYEGEFNIKMQTSAIDKFIRAELEERGYEKNTENWEKVLSEIETEIGSDRLELFKRLTKLVGYINAVNRLKKAKALKEKYLNSTNTD